MILVAFQLFSMYEFCFPNLTCSDQGYALQHRDFSFPSIFLSSPLSISALLVILFSLYLNFFLSIYSPPCCQQYAHPTSRTLLCVSLSSNSTIDCAPLVYLFICFWIFYIIILAPHVGIYMSKNLGTKIIQIK
jgi:hypothetical protein